MLLADRLWPSFYGWKIKRMFLTFKLPGLMERSRIAVTASNYDKGLTFSRNSAVVVRPRSIRVNNTENGVSLDGTPVEIVDDPTIAAALGLFRSRDERDQFIASIPVLDFEPLSPAQLYPPDDAWISESTLATKQWEMKLANATLQDPRTRRRPLVQIDGSGYRHIVRREESAIIRDAKSRQII